MCVRSTFPVLGFIVAIMFTSLLDTEDISPYVSIPLIYNVNGSPLFFVLTFSFDLTFTFIVSIIFVLFSKVLSDSFIMSMYDVAINIPSTSFL